MTMRSYPLKMTRGIVYVLLFELEGKTLIKIGVTTRSIEERVAEILVSIFQRYRVFPLCNPRRFTTTTNIYGKEKKLHELFKAHNHRPDKKFSGYTEFFDVPVDLVTEAYDKLVKPAKPRKARKPKKKSGTFFVVNKKL